VHHLLFFSTLFSKDTQTNRQTHREGDAWLACVTNGTVLRLLPLCSSLAAADARFKPAACALLRAAGRRRREKNPRARGFLVLWRWRWQASESTFLIYSVQTSDLSALSKARKRRIGGDFGRLKVQPFCALSLIRFEWCFEYFCVPF
jgi:hypothetical protein